MLVLTRKAGESIHIGGGIVIKVLDVRPSRIRLGIDAPLSIRVHRDERRREAEGRVVADLFTLDSPAEIC